MAATVCLLAIGAMPAGRQEGGGPLEGLKNMDSRLRGNDAKRPDNEIIQF